MNPIDGGATRAVEQALRGLALRGEVRAHNVANLNTPGFRARDVDFQAALRTAVATGTTDRMAAPQVVAGNGLPDASGNTVDLETEMVGMMKDQLLRDAMVNAFNFKAAITRAAITAR